MLNIEQFKQEIKEQVKEKLKNVSGFDLKLDKNKLIIFQDGKEIGTIDISKKDKDLIDYLKQNLETIKWEIKKELQEFKSEVFDKLSNKELIELYRSLHKEQKDNTLMDEAIEKVYIERLNRSLPAKLSDYIKLLKKYEGKSDYLLMNTRIAVMLSPTNDKEFNLVLKELFDNNEEKYKATLLEIVGVDKKFLYNYLNYRYTSGHTFILKKGERVLKVSDKIIQCNNLSYEYCKKINSLVFALLNTYNNGYFLYVKKFNFISNKLINLFDKRSFSKSIDELDKNLINLADNIDRMDLFRYYMKREGVLGAFNTMLDVTLLKDFNKKDVIKPLLLVGGFLFGLYYTFKKLGFWKGLGALFLGSLGLSVGGTYLGDYLKKEFGKDFAPDRWKEIADKNPDILNGIEFLKIFAGSLKISEILSVVKSDGDIDVDKFLNNLKKKNNYYYNLLKKLPKAQIDYLIKCGLVSLGLANWRVDKKGKITIINNKVNKDQLLIDYIKDFYNKEENKTTVLSIFPSAHAATLDSTNFSDTNKNNIKNTTDSKKSSKVSPEDSENKQVNDYIFTISPQLISYEKNQDHMVRARKRKEILILEDKFKSVMEKLGEKNSLESLSVKEQKLYLLDFYLSIWISKVQSILQDEGNGLVFWVQYGSKEKFKKDFEQILKDIEEIKNSDSNIDDKISQIISKTVDFQREHGFINNTILDNIYTIKSIIIAHKNQKDIYTTLSKLIENLREGYFTDGASELLPIYMQDIILNDSKFNKIPIIENLKKDILPYLYTQLYDLNNVSKWALLDSENNFYGYDSGKLFDFIKNILHKNDSLKSYFNEEEITEFASDISKQIFESGNLINQQLEKTKEQLEKEIEKFCKKEELSPNDCANKKKEFLNKYKIYTYISYMNLALQNAIIEKIFYKLDKDSISDTDIKEFIEKYKDILGIGWFNLSDMNKVALIDIASTIALSFIPLGSSIALGRISLGVFRWAANFSRLSELAKLPKVGRVIGAFGRGISSGLGNTFGYELGNQILYDWDSLGPFCFDNWGEFFKEWVKWTGYNMIFGVTNPIVGLINKLKIKPNDKILLKISNGGIKLMKYPAIGALDAGGMVAVDLGTDFAFDKFGLVEGEYEMNAQTFIQMMVFSLMMRGIGSSETYSKILKIKDKDGKDIISWPKMEGGNPDKLINFGKKIKSGGKSVVEGIGRKKSKEIKSLQELKQNIDILKNQIKAKLDEKNKLVNQINDIENKIKFFEEKNKQLEEVKDLIEKKPEVILSSKEKLDLFGLSNYKLKDQVKNKLEELINKNKELNSLKESSLYIENKNIKVQTLESEIQNIKNEIIGYLGVVKSILKNKISTLESKKRNIENQIKSINKEIENLNSQLESIIKNYLTKDIKFKKEIEVKFTSGKIEKTLKFDKATEIEVEGEKYWIVKGKNSDNIYILKPEIKQNQIVVKKGNIYKLDEFVKFKINKIEKQIDDSLNKFLNDPNFLGKLKNGPKESINKLKDNLIKLKNGEIDKETFMKNIGCRVIFGKTCDKVPDWKSKMKSFIVASGINSLLVLGSEVIGDGKLDEDILTIGNLIEIGGWNVVESFSNKFFVLVLIAGLVGKDYILNKEEEIPIK